MRKTPLFCIILQIDPPTLRPYRILETHVTSDGLRSRICEGTWKLLSEAQKAKDEKVKKCEAQQSSFSVSSPAPQSRGSVMSLEPPTQT